MNTVDATCEQACMSTSKDGYYTEMCNTVTDYNDHNNNSLSNEKIREAISNVMEEESIVDANNVTVDIFSHASSS